MRIAIVEDNAAQAAELVRMTEACAPFACEIGEEDVYSDADAFLAARRSYDLALIDCLLPGKSGVDPVRRIRKSGDVFSADARSVRAIGGCDLLVVVGSSLVVYPAAGLVRYCPNDAKFVIINYDPTPYDDAADLVIHEDISKVFEAL